MVWRELKTHAEGLTDCSEACGDVKAFFSGIRYRVSAKQPLGGKENETNRKSRVLMTPMTRTSLSSPPLIPPGSAVEEVVRDKKLWVQEWDDFEKSDRWVHRWVQMIVEAFGFPKAEKRKRK